jgi:tetratricopeptide (TPR) repeat protein
MCAGFALRRLNSHGAGARDEIVLKYFVPDPLGSEPECSAEGFEGERRGRLFLWAAVVLHVLGRVPAAVKFAEHAQEVFEKTQSGQHGLGFWCSSAYRSWFLAALGNLDGDDGALELSKRCIRGVELDLHDEPVLKRLALCLHACMVSYTGEFDQALEMYEKATANKCDMPTGFGVSSAILVFHYACLLLKRKRYADAEREARNLLEARQDHPVLGFLGYQLLARMELAKASEKIAERPRGKRGNPLLGGAKEYFDQGKVYLNLGPAHDQIIVNALFMAQFYRFSGNLEEADHYLKRAEEAVGPFVLLNIDCLLERARLLLAQGDMGTAMEKLENVHNLVDKHGYHCIDGDLTDLKMKLKKVKHAARHLG